MNKIKNTVLAVGAGVYALFACSVHAATVHFDFTSANYAANSLVDDGNRMKLNDTTDNWFVKGSAYAQLSGEDLDVSTLVYSEADYSDFGYRVNRRVEGLGVCSSGDSRGKLSRCIRQANQFSVDARSASEWVVLSLPDDLVFRSIEITATGRAAGTVELYSVELNSGGGLESMTSAGSFSYGRNAGAQIIGLDPVLGKTIAIAAENGSTRYTVTGLYAEVVPLPGAIWLMVSGLVVLTGAYRRRRTPTA